MSKQKPGAIAKKVNRKFSKAADAMQYLGLIVKPLEGFIKSAANYEFVLSMIQKGWVELVEGKDFWFCYQSGGRDVCAKSENLAMLFNPDEIEVLKSILNACDENRLFDEIGPIGSLGSKSILSMRKVLRHYEIERKRDLNHFKHIEGIIKPGIERLSGPGQKWLKDMIEKVTASPAE